MKLSVSIPVYRMHGEGENLLRRCLDSLAMQTFKDFEVVITDDSADDLLYILTQKYKLNINYQKNKVPLGMAQNANECIKRSKGELIKVLFQDDFLYDQHSLQDIVDNFKGEWLVTACINTNGSPHYPKYTEDVWTGNNRIGSPSVLTIKNENPLLFEGNLHWVLDCDLYKRYYDKFGEPTILNSVNVVIGLGKHQTSEHLTDQAKQMELDHLRKKYDSERSEA